MGSLTDFKKKYGIPVYEKEETPAASKAEKPDSLKKFMKRHGAIDYQERARQKQKDMVDRINAQSAPFLKTPQTPSEKSFDAVGKAHNAAAWSAQQAIYAAKEDRRKAGQTQIRQLEQELRLMETELEHYQNNTPMDWRSTTDRQTYTKGYEDRKSAISAKQAELNRARHLQEGYELAAVGDPASELYDPRFKEKSQYVSTKRDDFWGKLSSQYGTGYGDNAYEFINDRDGARSEILRKYAVMTGGRKGKTTYEEKGYDQMTADEIAVYNYYYAQDRKKAEQYLESLQDELSERAAGKRFETMEGKTARELMFAGEAGLDRASTGFNNLFRLGDDYIPASSTQVLSEKVREDLGDDGFHLPKWIGGASVAQMGYDAINSGANMLPSVLSSVAANAVVPGSGTVVGSAMMGGSLFGNAYGEMVNMGYTPGQAANYATLTAASEVLLQNVLGGFSTLGGALPKEASKLLLDKVDKAIARVAIRLGTNALGEFSEEYLQEVLEPWFQNIALQAQNDVDLISEEALYSGLLGAVTSLFMEGPGTIHQEHIRSQNTAQKSEAIPSPGGKVPEGRKGNGETSQVPSATLGTITSTTAKTDGSGSATTPVGASIARPTPVGADAHIGPSSAPLDPATLMDETIAQLRGAPADPIAAALDTIRSGGTVTNRQASDILANGNAVQQLVQQTGMTLPDTASGKRAAVKEALATLAARQPTDLAPLSHVIARSASDVAIPPATATPLGSPSGGAGTAQAVTLRPQARAGEQPPEGRLLASAEGVSPLLASAEGVSPTSTSAKEAPPVGASIARPTQATPSSDDGGDFPTSPLESSFGPNTVGSAQSAFEYKEKTSGLYGNTYENATSKDVQAIGSEAQSRDPRIGLYAVETEAESLFRAKQRTATEEDIDWEYDDLMDRDNWNGEDNDTAMRVLDHLRKSGDLLRFDELAAKQRELTTSSAQMTQSFAKYTRQTTTATAVEAMGKVNELSEHDIQKRAYKKQGFDQWQQDLKQTILDLSNQIDGVTTGDVVSMREVIRALAQFRRTTAWMGYSSKLTKIADSALGTLDFETLKAVANAQLSMIPEDFRRRSVGQIVRTIRIHNMLSSLATFNRNAIGNVSGGLVDGFSDSTVGRGLDVLVSLATGKRTVGNDIIHGKTYLSAATKAAKMAAMCVELDIPMDSESRFSVGHTRTHSPQRGIIGRFLSAYEKVMRHALEVSDQFFEGGSAGAVRKSLEDLGAKSGLTDDEISAVAGKVGKRRTYKDDRKLTRGAKLIKRGLDEFGSDELGLGDLVMPFTGTSSNLGQTAVDYSGAGVFTGLYEIMKLIRDVRRGDYEGGSKTTTHRGQSRTVTLVEAQRQAVTNAARGITGAGLVAAFAAMALTGIIRVHDDEDKDARALDQSQDLSGAQFNVDAMLRAFNGEDTAWQAGDHTVTIDFLEPFNAQMYIGYILSQEETVADMLKAYPGASLEGIVRSILDMPMMQGLSETADLISGIGRSLEEGDEVSDWGSVASDVGGQLLGSTGTSFIPAWLRQSAYMADPYYRDTTGDDPMEKAMNQIKSNIPGLSTTLPMKYSGLGEEQHRHEGGISGFFNTFVNPGKISTIDVSDIAAAVDRISEATGNLAIYPEDKAPASFTYDGTTVTISGKEMTETYQRTYGESVATLYDELIASEDFQSLPAADQASVLEKAKTYATHLARASVSDYNKVPAYIAEKGKGVSEASAILRHHVASIISGAFTSLTTAWKNGTSADASVSKLNEVYDTLQALPTKTRAAITKELTGRQAAFVEAKKAGLTTESFTDLYRQYRDIEATSKTASQKAQDWSHALELSRSKGQISTKQRDILKDKLYFSSFIPQDAGKYDAMISSGIPAGKADYVTDLLAGILPEDGYTTVRQIQKMEAIVSDRSLTSYTDDLLHVLLDDKADEKYDRSRALGLEADEYVQLYRHYLDDRKKASFLTFCKNELSLSTSTAETLYKIWSGKD